MPSGVPPEIVTRAREPQLVGRDEALAELDDEVKRVLSGSFRVVLIEGEAGIGKTRFLAEVLARHADDAACLSARSYRWGGTSSFGPWVEALDRRLRDESDADVRRLCGASLSDLATLLKAAEAVAPARHPQPSRARLFEALVDLFDRLSQERALLVALDDAHLADASSWEALRYLGRRLSGSSIGILLGARPAELRRYPVAAETLLGLGEDGALHRLTLAPLTHEDVAELASDIVRSDSRAPRSSVPQELASWLLERSLGHPLFVVGLLRALLEERADLTSPQLERLPESLHERVSLELEGLDPGDRSILEALAVADRRVDLSDVERISGRSADELAVALEGLCQSRLVAEHGAGPRLAYEIAHPVIQETIYEGIGGARRRALHRSVARTLLDAGHLGAAASHFARSAEPDEAEAVDALCRAMRQAEERGLYQEALATLAALLDVLPAGDRRWLQVLATMDWQPDWVLSHLAESEAGIAIKAMERIDPLARASGDLAAEGTVKLHLASFLSFGAGRLDEAELACHGAIACFDAARDRERALLARHELAWIHGCAGELERSAALAGEVLDEAEASGHARPAIHAAGCRSYALARIGRFDEAEDRLRQAIRLARAEGETYRVAWARNHLGVTLSLAGRLQEGAVAIEAALEEDPAAPDSGTLEYLAHTDWLGGRLTSCVARVKQSEVRRPMHRSRRRGWALAIAARAYAEMAQHGNARRSLDHARGAYQGRQILEWTCMCDWAEGILHHQNRERERALASLERVLERLETMGAGAYEALVLVDVAEIAADGRDAARTDAAARRVADIARDVGGGLHPSLAALVAAWSHLASGRFDQAAGSANEAAKDLSAAGYRLHAGSAIEVHGRALEARDRLRAIDVLREAAAAFDRCEAVWRRDRMLSHLSRLGSRGRRAAAAQGREALTEREREVAQLAVHGYTAQQTGEQLFIGKRTVESHLASIYAKLGVRSKRELAQRARELGL